MADILEKISQIGIVPVIAIDDARQAVPLAGALAAGGLPAAEVTFRTAAGEEAIRRIAGECPESLLGAGTVLNEDQCRRAIRAGARFIVSPGYDQRLVDLCREQGVTVLPGCGGTWMVKKDLIRAERWDTVTEICREAVRAALDLRVRGVSPADRTGLEQTLTALLAVDQNADPWELTLDTPDVGRAVYHLGRAGAVFEEQPRLLDQQGRCAGIRLKDPVFGMTCGIVRR